MNNYKRLNSKTLLVKSNKKRKTTIHGSFIDNHVMNLVDDIVISNDPTGNPISFLMNNTKKRREKIYRRLNRLKLYKYIDIKYLSYILKRRLLFFDRVKESWEDPYENFFLKENFYLKDGTTATASNNIWGVFGQCWTCCKETDAMWRIYSHDDVKNNKHKRNFHGIRIGTTAKKLLDIIYVNDDAMSDTWIGKVVYRKVDDLNKILQDGITNIEKSLGDCFFVKRKEFDHEREFRAIKLMDTSTINQTYMYKRIAFTIPDLDNFIDSYTLDPRLSDADYNSLRDKLIQLGVKPDKICKSNLYEFVPIEVEIQK